MEAFSVWIALEVDKGGGILQVRIMLGFDFFVSIVRHVGLAGFGPVVLLRFHVCRAGSRNENKENSQF